MALSQELDFLFDNIEETRIRSPLAAPRVTLVGVSKQQPTEILGTAIAAGLRHFGENRVQEAEAKWPEFKARCPDLQLHLIGPLQRNKVREAVALFDVIHTLDRESLAETLAAEMERSGKRVPCLIQVNTGEEAQKAGVAPRDADTLIQKCREEYKLPVIGLMCVPPVDKPAGPHFALLREMALRHKLTELSMGMSGDYETAIRFGATMVRIGTALFGERR